MLLIFYTVSTIYCRYQDEIKNSKEVGIHIENFGAGCLATFFVFVLSHTDT